LHLTSLHVSKLRLDYGFDMKFSRRTLLNNAAAASLLSTLPLSACRQVTDETSIITKTSDDSVMSLLESATDFMLNAYPESASSAGIDKGKYAGLKSELTDRSPEGQDKIKRDAAAILGKLNNVDMGAVTPETALNVDVVRSVFETSAQGFDFPYGDMALLNSNWSYRNSPYAVAQNTGAFVEIPSFLDSSHKINTTSDADAYLERMQAYAAQLDGETERTRIAGEKGIILPDFLIKKTLSQLRSARSKSTDDWGIVTSLIKRTALWSDSGVEPSYAKAGNIARDIIGPAIDRQIAVHEALAPKAPSDAGVWAKPGGKAYYDWTLRAATTTTLSPDDVHQMGLDELAQLQGRMDPILRSIGYTDGSVGERMSALGKDKRYHFAPGDPGRAEIMTFINEAVEDIRGRMPRAFETLVPGFLEVTRISPDVEDGAPGAYGGAGSIDGTKPGHFWINLRSTSLHNKFNLADLTYHEAIPGHVWQGEYT